MKKANSGTKNRRVEKAVEIFFLLLACVCIVAVVVICIFIFARKRRIVKEIIMDINFKGLVDLHNLPSSEPLLPLFEAIVNSIQSIIQGNINDGKISCHILEIMMKHI